MLRRLQRGLEHLYRLSDAPDVRQFLLDEEARDVIGAERTSREQVFVSGDAEDLELAVFLDRAALDNLERRDPSAQLDESNLEDLLLAVEGVSHFLCVIHAARSGRRIRQLELELQAEIDKFVVCLLLLEDQGVEVEGFGPRLTGGLRLADDLDHEQRQRYAQAGDLALSYVEALDRRFVRLGRLDELLKEIRLFYRLPLGAKREHITKLAA